MILSVLIGQLAETCSDIMNTQKDICLPIIPEVMQNPRIVSPTHPTSFKLHPA